MPNDDNDRGPSLVNLRVEVELGLAGEDYLGEIVNQTAGIRKNTDGPAEGE